MHATLIATPPRHVKNATIIHAQCRTPGLAMNIFANLIYYYHLVTADMLDDIMEVIILYSILFLYTLMMMPSQNAYQLTTYLAYHRKTSILKMHSIY